VAKRNEFLVALVEATAHPSVVHGVTVRYVITLKCPKFRSMPMCKADGAVLELVMILKAKKPIVCGAVGATFCEKGKHFCGGLVDSETVLTSAIDGRAFVDGIVVLAR
jgi:hypothetical protein